MRLLPKWALLDPPSAIYDFASVTPLQQTARVYGTMQQMIQEYNSFADQLNREIESFTGSSETEIANFKRSIEERLLCKFNDIDAKMGEIKTEIARYNIEWLEKNAPNALPVVTTAENGKLLAVKDGTWKPAVLVYNAAEESINIV